MVNDIHFQGQQMKILLLGGSFLYWHFIIKMIKKVIGRLSNNKKVQNTFFIFQKIVQTLQYINVYDVITKTTGQKFS